MFLNGHFPRMPELVYLLKNDKVQNLIHLRMTGGEGSHHQKISIKMQSIYKRLQVIEGKRNAEF